MGKRNVKKNRRRALKRRDQRELDLIIMNTIMAEIGGKEAADYYFPLEDLINDYKAQVQSEREAIDRFGKLISIGVQALPYRTVEAGQATSVETESPVLMQIGLKGTLATSGDSLEGTAGPYVAQKPPQLLSFVNPTNFKLTPTGPYQRQPIALNSDNNGLNVRLRYMNGNTGILPKIFLTIHTKFKLLPQTEFKFVTPKQF